MTTQLATINTTVNAAKQQFMEIAKSTGVNLSFEKECSFALQILRENDFLSKVAIANPASLQSAITNIANIGLSLNTANKHAYLVPRGNKVSLDISYIGLLHLAAKEGRIKNANADVVREGDKFTFNGKNKQPDHSYDPFDSEREKKRIIGAYCIAIMPDNSVMVEIMNRAEVEKSRDCSSMKDKTVWSKWEAQMFIKTVVKRAAKFWVYGGNDTSFTAKAIEYLNTDAEEGLAPKSANADNLSSLLHDAPEIIEAELEPEIEQPKKTLTAVDYIWQIVEEHGMHDLLDVQLQLLKASKVEHLTVEQRRLVYKNLQMTVKKKLNGEI